MLNSLHQLRKGDLQTEVQGTKDWPRQILTLWHTCALTPVTALKQLTLNSVKVRQLTKLTVEKFQWCC